MKKEVWYKEKEHQSKFYQQVGKTIHDKRKAIGLTQEDLAFFLGITRVSMINIESGRQRCGLHTFRLLANLLSITMDELTPPFTHGQKQMDELLKERTRIAVEKAKQKVETLTNFINTTSL